MIDYRSLLIRYMALVGTEEGTHFLGAAGYYKYLFSEDEVVLLGELSYEADNLARDE